MKVYSKNMNINYKHKLNRKSTIRSRVPSANYSKKTVGKFKPAYDTSVTPVELRNHNLYVQSIQQRLPPALESPLPSLHPNFQLSRQKHVGGGGLIVQTKQLPSTNKVKNISWL